MDYGTHLFATEFSIQPDEFARESEERGFESTWFSEHTHIPVNFLNSSERGPSLPDHYWQTYDPFIASTMAAIATTKIKVATGVSLVNQHDAITLAKTVATVDQLSSGRFIFGVGAGWLAEEMENHGVNYRTRFRLLDENISAMKQIWSQREPEFNGEFIKFSKMNAYPKPIQTPHPMIVGGGSAGPKSLEFVVNHCNGWMPILGNQGWMEIKKGIGSLHQLAQKTKRDPDSIELSIFCWSPPDDKTLEDMQSNGITKLVISFEGRSREDAMPLLDEYANLIENTAD